MLKRLEPVFIPKQRLYKRGVLHHKDLQSETSKDECKTPTSNIEIKDSPPKDEKTSAKNKREKQPRKSKSLRRALFQDVSKENSTILDIAEENCSKNNDKQIEDGFKFPEDAEVIEVCIHLQQTLELKKRRAFPSKSLKANHRSPRKLNRLATIFVLFLFWVGEAREGWLSIYFFMVIT